MGYLYFCELFYPMTRYQKLCLLLITGFLTLCSARSVQAQTVPDWVRSRYKLEYIGAARTDTTHGVMVVFKVSRATDKKKFKPVLSMKLAYAANRDSIKVIDILHQPGGAKVYLEIYGKNFADVYPALYAGIKDRLIFEEDMQLLVFRFRDISPGPVEQMHIKYGIWDKYQSIDFREEKEFDFPVTLSIP